MKQHMAKEHPRLKLGKTAAFVKTHLRRLPQENETWEADFRACRNQRARPKLITWDWSSLCPGGILWFASHSWNTTRMSTIWPTSWPTQCIAR